MPVDLTGLGYFMPIFGFLFVFLIVLALLQKIKVLGDSKFINVVISFIVAIIFSLMASTQEYVQAVTPWFAVLIIALFFILVIIGMSQSKISDIMKPWFVWVFIALLILVFLISAVNVFVGGFGSFWVDVTDFITIEARVAGAVILLIVAALAAWVVTKK